jgi:hypothetical protein
MKECQCTNNTQHEHKKLQDCNVHKMIWKSGILLAFICGAKHKRRGTSEVQGKTRGKNIKDTSIKVIPQLTVFWDKHITLRMTSMLSRRCLKLEDENST